MKNIVVNIKNEDDLYEKYNDDISHDLLNFLVRQANVRDEIKITINTNLDIDNLDNLIKKEINKAYKNTERSEKNYDYKQILFFITGVIFLLFSSLINIEVVNEILLITGWVAICEFLEISLKLDKKQRLKMKIMKKILTSEITINKSYSNDI